MLWRRVTAWAVILAVLCSAGCVSAAVQRVPGEAPIPHAYWYDRAASVFETADFWKPAESSAGGIEDDLAPLIVQEVVTGDGGSTDPGRFGAVYLDNAGNVRVNPEEPTVYAAVGTMTFRGVEHEVAGYVWCYPPSGPGSSGDAIRCRRLWMMLDAEGFPLVLEIIPSFEGSRMAPCGADDLHVLFVSASLERRAAQTLTPPLPGRRYVVERSRRDAPCTVVAGVVEDGPIPMGPYVYLDSTSQSVTTLHCRCSPSQMERILTSGYYELRPWEELTALLSKSEGGWWQSGSPMFPVFSGGQWKPSEALRWPVAPGEGSGLRRE